MKVLMLNGSANPDGSTMAGLMEMASVFSREGVETEIVQIGGKPIADCIACGGCEDHCPQHLEIRELLRTVSAKFDR